MSSAEISDPGDHDDPSAEEHRGRYYGVYTGYVKDRNDPLKAGRIRVHLPALFPGDGLRQDNWTDWSRPINRGLAVPPLGHPVTVTFEHGIINSGFYQWGWMRGTTAQNSEVPETGRGLPDPTYSSLSEASGANFVGPTITAEAPNDPAADTPPKYPDCYVYKSPSGIIIEEDNTPGEVRLRVYHPAGTSLLIDPAGNLHMRVKGGIIHECEGDYTMKLKPGATFRCLSEDGSGFVCGPGGFHVNAHIARINNRTINNTGLPIK